MPNETAWLAEQEQGCLLQAAFSMYLWRTLQGCITVSGPVVLCPGRGWLPQHCLSLAHILRAPPPPPPALQSSDQARPRPRLAGHLPFPSMLLHACKAVSSTRPSPLSQRTRRAQGWQRPRELGALRCLSREASVAPGS